jgi:arsenate reductase
MTVVIHHNPRCGTSRNVLAFIAASGETPVVIPYLETGWTRPQLLGLFAAANLTPRTALRAAGTPAAELGLLDPAAEEESLLARMVEHPILVNRPIVCAPRGVRLCRPSESVFDILDRLPRGQLAKEDGTLVIDAAGRRVETET